MIASRKTRMRSPRPSSAAERALLTRSSDERHDVTIELGYPCCCCCCCLALRIVCLHRREKELHRTIDIARLCTQVSEVFAIERVRACLEGLTCRCKIT